MSKIVFAAISPHPPIILPSVGSPEDRAQVKNTIKSLENLREKLREAQPDSIIISSPHSDWGFDVPLHFLAKDFKGKLKQHLIGLESPQFYFEEGKKTYQKMDKDEKYALIASGDMSHCLKEEGPYGFQPDGPKFDKALIEFLKKKDVETILKLDDMYPEAGECGLRSFCFLLGILEQSGTDYQPEILSYEGPFGVGYLVANFKIKNEK
jgi:aromatic ring-opening dioxygenase LigB subunit